MPERRDERLDLTTAKDVEIIPARSLHRKLAQVMYEAERIPKNGTAPREMGGYKFVQVGDAADFIRKALAEKVITMMPTCVQVVAQHEGTTKSGAPIMTVDLITEWTLTDGESGESITIMSYGAGADMGDKYSGKASTSAMKYALLTGFLLSTGEDSEVGMTPERQPTRGSGLVSDAAYAESIAHDEPIEHNGIGGLVGTVEKGKPPVDMEVRYTKDEGAAWGFRLKGGGTAFQVLAKGQLAEDLANREIAVGTRVTVWGPIEAIPWDKKQPDGTVKTLHYNRLAAERVKGPDFDFAAPVEAPSIPLFSDAEEETIDKALA